MKPVIIIAIAFVLLTPIPFYDYVYAYTNQHDVSISSSGSQFGPAKIRIDYTVTVDVERPSELDPGEAFTVTISPRDGRITYNIDIDILGESFSIPLFLNLGEKQRFNITPGIDAYVVTSASSDVQILGPVTTKQQTLHWQNPTSQTIQSSVNNNVGSSGDVVIQIPIVISVDAGLTLNLLGIFEENIAEKTLGTFSAHPVIEEHISINRPDVSVTGSSGSLGWIFLIIIIIIIALVIRKISKRRKRKKESKKE